MSIFNKKKTTEVKAEAKPTVVVKEAKPAKTVAKPAATEVKTPKKSDKKKQAIHAYRVLLKPVISEKATIGASLNKYTFKVTLDANKVEIKKAIEEVYNVVPKSVAIVNQRGKDVRFGKHSGTTRRVKKAVITLKKGDSIKLYEGI